MRGIKRILGIAVTLAMLMSMVVVPVSVKAADDDLWTAEGNYDYSWYNDEETVFEISSAKQLAGLAKLVNEGKQFYRRIINITNDMDLSEHIWVPIGYYGASGNKFFAGTFLGNGHNLGTVRLTDASKPTSDACTYGLFGFVYYGSVDGVRLQVQTSDILDTRIHVGGIVGWLYKNSSISNCNVSGEIKGMSNYWSGTADLGGICGSASDTHIDHCYNEATISTIAEGSGNGHIGGIVGSSEGCTIMNCHNNGTIVGNYGSEFMGGIAGSFSYIDNWVRHIVNSYNSGTVLCSEDKQVSAIGGIVGGFGNSTADGPYVSNSYNIGLVSESGHLTGAVIGYVFGGSINNTYWLHTNDMEPAG